MKNVQTAQTQKYKPGQYIVSLDHLNYVQHRRY